MTVNPKLVKELAEWLFHRGVAGEHVPNIVAGVAHELEEKAVDAFRGVCQPTPAPIDDASPLRRHARILPVREPDETPIVAGRKDDGGKAPLSLLGMVTRALADVTRVQAFGATKYPSPDNWKHVSEGSRRYRDAALRHLFADLRGQALDPETGLPHLAHAACCILIAAEHDMGFEELAQPPLQEPAPGETLPAWRFLRPG